MEIVKCHLQRLFKVSLTFRYIPVTLVVFISSRHPMDRPKSYFSISNTSFLLRTLEKRIDQYITNEALPEKPPHTKQLAYQAGIYTIS